MDDSDNPHRPGSVEIMPPALSHGNLPALNSEEAIKLRFAFVQRLKIWGAQRVMDGLAALMEAEGRAFEEAETRDLNRLRYEKTQGYLQEIDSIREDARKEALHEIRLHDLRRAAEIEDAEKRLETAIAQRKTAQIISDINELREQRKYDGMFKTTDKQSGVEREVGQARKKLNALTQVDALRDELLRKYNVEDEKDLPPGEAQVLKQLRSDLAMGNIKL